jgi:hypothetical protein
MVYKEARRMDVTDKNINVNELSERELLILLNYKMNVMQGDFKILETTSRNHDTEITKLKENARGQASMWGAITAAVISGLAALISKFTAN